MNNEKNIEDLTGILRRRKKGFILTFFSVFILSVIIAVVLPPVFRSESTILIEEQQIPQDYVKSTITSFVEERLQTITQQIMSRTKLMGIIDQFNLYADMKERSTTEQILDKMREDIHLETISADVIDRRTGRPSTATIAFTLSFEGKYPNTTLKVANTLASLYLEENLKARERRATNTTQFLERELDNIKNKIDSLEKNLSEFKAAHVGELPEHNQVNLQAIARLERDMDQINMQTRSAEERRIYLKGQLAIVEPFMDPLTSARSVTRKGKIIESPEERLEYLRLELINLQSSLSEKHPDIRRLKKEIRELESQAGEAEGSASKAGDLEILKQKMAQSKAKLGPKHPDVKGLSKKIAALSREIKESDSKKPGEKVNKKGPDNPAYINLMTQVASAETELKGLFLEKKRLAQKMEIYHKKLEKTPMVEREYQILTRDYEGARHKYNEIMDKLMEARVAQGMEETQTGERFTIIDPAQLPERPFKPNRIAIVLIGFVLALGAGVGIAAVRESLDNSVKTVSELQRAVDVPVFSAIPLIETDKERRIRYIKVLVWFLVIVAVIGAGLLFVNHYVMPLDILWIKIQRKVVMEFPTLAPLLTPTP